MDDPIQTPAAGQADPQATPAASPAVGTEPQPNPAPAEQTPPAPDAPATPAKQGGLLGEDTPNGAAESDPSNPQENPQEDPNKGVLGAPQDGYNQEGMQNADAEIAQAFMGVAKELNLSQESVDKLYGAVAPVMQKRAADMMNKAEEDWRAQSLADPEFGGNDFQKNAVQMNRAFAKYASPELKKLFRESRLDCHPEVLRMFYHISQDISEDVLLKGNGGTGRTGRSNDPRDMYPNTKMNL